MTTAAKPHIPEGWESRRLKTVLAETDRRNEHDGSPLLSLTREHGLILQSESSSGSLVAQDLGNYKVCNPGDLVMNRMQAWSGMFATASTKGLVSPDYTVFQPKGANDVRYLEHLVKTPYMVEQFTQRSKGIGSGFNRLYTGDFGDCRAPMPPPEQQAAIVRYLDHADELINRYISAKEQLTALLEEQRQAVIQQAVTRGLDPNVPLKPSGVDWLGDVPEHWEVVQLGRIGVFTKGSGGTKDDEVPDGIPCVRYGDLYTTHQYFMSQTRSHIPPAKANAYTEIKRGDVLFPTSGETIEEIGKSAVNLMHGHVRCGGDLIIFRPTIPMEPRFAGYALGCPAAQTQKSLMGRGITIMHIYSGQLKYLWLPLPPLAEQTAIVEYLDRTTANADAAIARVRRQIELVEEYRTRLIADVVTGQIDVRDAVVELPD